MPIPNLPTIQQVPGGGDYLQAPIYNPAQESMFENLLQLGGQRLANPTQGFAPYEQRAREQFMQNTIPGLAERFTAMGGGQRSSAFQGALGQAASDLESQLAQLRSSYGQQQEQMGLNLASLGLTPQYSQAYYQPTNVAGQIGQMAGQTGTQIAGQVLPGVIQGALNRLGGNAGTNTNPSAGTNAATAAGTAAGTALGAAGSSLLPAAGTAVPAGTAGATAATGATGAAATGVAAKAAGATSLAGALKAVGAVGMPAAVALLGAWWFYGMLKKDPSQPGQFPNPFQNGTYYDKDGNRIVSQGNTIQIFDPSGKLIDTQAFAGPNQNPGQGGGGVAPQPGQKPKRVIYNYYGSTSPKAGPFYEY